MPFLYSTDPGWWQFWYWPSHRTVFCPLHWQLSSPTSTPPFPPPTSSSLGYFMRIILAQFNWFSLFNICANLQAPSDNGSAITNYRLEWNKGEKGGPFTEVYCGQQRQFRLTHKLPPATPCSFRVQAVNGIGARWLLTFSHVGMRIYVTCKSELNCCWGKIFSELIWRRSFA